MVTFLYENRDSLVQLDPPASVWRKIKALATRFDNKDLSSHTFRKSEMGDRSGINGMDAVTTSPATNYPPSSSSLLSPNRVILLSLETKQHLLPNMAIQ